MIIIICVAERAMFDIFETWNASNPELSKVLNWSLSTNPCTNWTGVSCLQFNQSTDEDTQGDDVSSLRYVTYLVPMLISSPKINVAHSMCHDTRKFVGLNVKEVPYQMNVYMILGSTLD